MNNKYVALYSLEWGLSDAIPIFNGGLGTLNGCLLNSFADLGYPVVGVGLIYNKGFLEQRIVDNRQQSFPVSWNPEQQGFERLLQKVRVKIYNQDVVLGAWGKKVTSPISGKSVDLVLLDATLPENPEWVREFSDFLYDDRFKQVHNVMLGFGGPAMLQALRYDVATHHAQEGHAATLMLKLLIEKNWNVGAVSEMCIFTNHTPLRAGMPTYALSDIEAAIGHTLPERIRALAGNDGFNTNIFAANLSRYVNAVSKKHADVLQQMPEFKGKAIDYITNGVHWRFMSQRMQQLLDSTVGGEWRLNPQLLIAASVTPDQLEAVHQADKKDLIDFLNEHALKGLHFPKFEYDAFTPGFARRFAEYKRAWLPLADKNLLAKLPGIVQLPYSGKAHRSDGLGQGVLNNVLTTGFSLDQNVRFGFLQNYGIEIAKLMVAGSDLWIVAAIPHEEASGTSPMKAGFHGNKTLSTDGGFWPEVAGRFGELGYTFGGATQEEEIRRFNEQLVRVMTDLSSGKTKADRLSVMQEFLINFSAVRIARDYGWVYGFEKERQKRPGPSLEQLVTASASA